MIQTQRGSTKHFCIPSNTATRQKDMPSEPTIAYFLNVNISTSRLDEIKLQIITLRNAAALTA